MLVNREVVLVRTQTAPGTPAVPAAGTHAVLVEGPSWSQEGLRMVERPAVRANIGTLRHLYAGMLRSVSFDVELKGAGAPYNATTLPEMDALLGACGMGRTIVTTGGSESVTYQPASTGHEIVTIYYYQDGTLMQLTDCRGEVEFALEVGGRGMASFKMMGHSATVTDAALVSPTYDSTLPPPVIGAAFSVGGFAAVIASLSVSLGNTVATPPDMNQADGYATPQITKRDVNGSFDPEAVTVATEDFEAQLRSGVAMALTTGSIGNIQYARYTISMPAISYRSQGPADRDGVRTFDMAFGAEDSVGDDEIAILFN